MESFYDNILELPNTNSGLSDDAMYYVCDECSNLLFLA